MKNSLLFCLAICSSLNLSAQDYYEKFVTFPTGSTLEQKIDMASRLIPTKQQKEWQEMEFTCFLHFGMNTFTGREWGDGTEDPKTFNPTELDCDQWVKALKEGGFKMAILTAKHHDGFCLWPTKTTDHSVASSSWKGGKGDVVAELRKACTKYGLKFGVYLSPWDRHAPCYGEGEVYNKYFIEQLTELLTNYGEVHEVWFDGANGEGPNGKKQEYDWDAILKTIHTLQPNAVTAIMGDDVRWVGNEGGVGRETEWSATINAPGSYTQASNKLKERGITNMSPDLGSRYRLKDAECAYWYPSEVDVSIRPGWFFHEEENSKVRSLANLVDIYYKSVGRNSVLLLNIPPTTKGLIHDIDATNIKQLNTYLNETFKKNLLGKASSFSMSEGETKVFDVKKGSLVNTVMLQEDITKGQRIEDFLVEALIDGWWKVVARGTTVGYKRLLKFDTCQPTQLRVTLYQCRGTANISNLGAYFAEPLDNSTVDKKIKRTWAEEQGYKEMIEKTKQ